MSSPDAKAIISLFEGLRVADVRDGMDWAGLHFQGSVPPQDVAPLVDVPPTVGLARTIKLRPTEKTVPDMTPEEYSKWAYDYWYGTLYQIPLTDELQPGEMVVIESAGIPDIGEVGSNNSLEWYAAGAVGIVTSGGVRDLDECRHQQVPIYHRYRAQKMVQGRVEYEASQVPVNICGVAVRPGDVVVADGDGVVVVPIEHAEVVAKYARQELDFDKLGRRKLYEKISRELDDTVL